MGRFSRGKLIAGKLQQIGILSWSPSRVQHHSVVGKLGSLGLPIAFAFPQRILRPLCIGACLDLTEDGLFEFLPSVE